MEKTLNLEHNNYIMVSPLRRELEIPDYGDRDFLISSEPLGNAMSVFVSNRYSEYRKLGFPLWRRVDIGKIALPPVSGKNGKHYPDPYVKPLSGLQRELNNWIIWIRGSDRKLLLPGRYFFDTGYFFQSLTESILKNLHIQQRGDESSISIILRSRKRFIYEDSSELDRTGKLVSSDNRFSPEE